MSISRWPKSLFRSVLETVWWGIYLSSLYSLCDGFSSSPAIETFFKYNYRHWATFLSVCPLSCQPQCFSHSNHQIIMCYLQLIVEFVQSQQKKRATNYDKRNRRILSVIFLLFVGNRENTGERGRAEKE